MTKAVPTDFSVALSHQMRKHGETGRHLYLALKQSHKRLGPKTITQWSQGICDPTYGRSLAVLVDIERRYDLPPGHLIKRLSVDQYAYIEHVLKEKFTGGQQRILRWHLPDNFRSRSVAKQHEILSWIRKNVFVEGSEFSRYMSDAKKYPYAVRFSCLETPPGSVIKKTFKVVTESKVVKAPKQLEEEFKDLIECKTSILSKSGFKRYLRWSEETAEWRMRRFGVLFGTLAASPESSFHGLGIPPCRLTMGLLVFPRLWDWFLIGREKRRGFYTRSEVGLLDDFLSIMRPITGWIRQRPRLAARVMPIKGLISPREIERAKSNWEAACEVVFEHAKSRLRDIRQAAKTHRDPFYPILKVLEADKPLREYRKIAEEVLRRMPDKKKYPLEAAEAARGYLLLRLGMHLGVRRRNLSQLLFTPRKEQPRREVSLVMALRGELRWNSHQRAWEVFIPYQAFKNKHSSFFSRKPFLLVLPNVAGLYQMIDEYIERHRTVLLARAPDPQTFFVRSTARPYVTQPEYNGATMNDAWKTVVQRYGIYNPYTDRGAIEGLLPHGPHSIRDVIATHVIKTTGSFTLASYAIQATPDVVAEHYARFFPHDKSAKAAQVLNKVWVR